MNKQIVVILISLCFMIVVLFIQKKKIVFENTYYVEMFNNSRSLTSNCIYI